MTELAPPTRVESKSRGGRPVLTALIVLTGVFLSSLDLFIVNIAFPSISASFHGESTNSLSWVLSAYAIVFAAALVPAGRWADRTGSRMRPLRQIAVVTSVVLMVLVLADQRHSPIALAAMVVALAITGDNGLPFTSVPEIAGRYWSGRALGAQNTVERLTVAVGPPAFGALISATGYPLAFAVCGLFPLAALPFFPVAANRTASASTPSPL